MFVKCPHCDGLVALERDSGQPPERCPLCDGLMVAEPTVPDAADPTLPDPDDGVDVPSSAVEPDDAAPALSPAHEPDDEDLARSTSADDDLPDAQLPEPGPEIDTDAEAEPASGQPVDAGTQAEFEHDAGAMPPPAARPRRRWELAAVAALALALLLQLFALQRDALAADPQWRPWMQRLCNIAGCQLAPWREPAAIRLLQRSVQADPARPGTLQVRMRMRNEAAWPQPWPRLQLTLSDIDGQPLATRVFEPGEYLGRAPDAALLPPGAEAEAAFGVREPERASVAFDFRFL